MNVAFQRYLKYGSGILRLRRDDVWLSSFPRAGSTWIRFILCNLITLFELGGASVDYHLVSAMMPSLGRSDLHKPWSFKILPRFVKTHQPYRRVLFAVPRRAVYVLRDPRDLMVSYYHYQRGMRKNTFHGSFSEFIRDARSGLSSCVKNYVSWVHHCTFVLRYENLLQDPTGEVKRMLHGLQIEVPDDLLQQAIERSDFKKMRKIQATSGVARPELLLNSQQPMVRAGRSKQWAHYFSDEDLIFYEQVCREYAFDLYNEILSEECPSFSELS